MLADSSITRPIAQVTRSDAGPQMAEVFSFNGHSIRIAVDASSEPWFVASDICRVLGYSRIADAMRMLDDDDLGTHFVVSSDGRQRRATTISEPGMYVLTMASKRPDAKPFKRWVTHDILPTLRKTGAYGIPSPRFDIPQTLPAALRAYADEAEAHEATKAKVAELTPAAAAWDAIASGKGTASVGEAAKMLKNAGIDTGPNRLFATLEARKWIYRNGKGKTAGYTAYANHVDAGRLTMKYQSRPELDENGDEIGRKDAPHQVRITPKGLEDLLVVMTREQFGQPMLALDTGVTA